jgi:hypothetical protein
MWVKYNFAMWTWKQDVPSPVIVNREFVSIKLDLEFNATTCHDKRTLKPHSEDQESTA